MRKYSPNSSVFNKSFGIEMASLEFQKKQRGAGYSFGVVAPGEVTERHIHDEIEAFIVIGGNGIINSRQDEITVQRGDVVIFNSFDEHVLRNDGQEKLEFVDVYWKDPISANRQAERTANEVHTGPVFVFSTPPTPNGDLHLGHLSGPYFGADVHTRFLRARGFNAYHLTGSDDFQSYVHTRADENKSSPEEVARLYAKEIQETLSLLDCQVDNFVQTHGNAKYAAYQASCFKSLSISPLVELRESSALFDYESGKYLYEPDVSGSCPNCENDAGGNICEECGYPNLCHNLGDAKSRCSAMPPTIKKLRRYEIQLDKVYQEIRNHLLQSGASPRILDLLDNLINDGALSVPISHPAKWGLPANEINDQVIWVWPEMAFGFLYNISDLGRKIGADWNAESPNDDWKFVHFFGFDNSFYHTILYPALYREVFSDWAPNIEYHVNEFYLLDDKKFSTSRNHAVWGKELLNEDTVDIVRLHLGLTRPEDYRSNFSFAALKKTEIEIFHGVWVPWLRSLNDYVSSQFQGRVPDAGDWAPQDRSFLADIVQFTQSMAKSYSGSGYSVRQAAQLACTFFQRCSDYHRVNCYASKSTALFDRYRTSIALQCLSVATIAQILWPLMPRFAEQLAEGIENVSAGVWPETVERLPAGSYFVLQNTLKYCSRKSISIE